MHVDTEVGLFVPRFSHVAYAIAKTTGKVFMCTCWSPNWNEPQTGSGTPQFGFLTNPYPNRFGESPNQYGDCFFCVFFSVTHKIGLFSPNRQQHSNNFSYPHFKCEGCVGAHPARVGACNSMPPDEAETEGVWVRRWDAVVGGVSLRSGQRTERDKKIEKKNVFALYGHLPVIQTQQPTKTHARNAGDKCEEVRPVRSAGGARFDRWGQSSWAGV